MVWEMQNLPFFLFLPKQSSMVHPTCAPSCAHVVALLEASNELRWPQESTEGGAKLFQNRHPARLCVSPLSIGYTTIIVLGADYKGEEKDELMKPPKIASH